MTGSAAEFTERGAPLNYASLSGVVRRVIQKSERSERWADAEKGYLFSSFLGSILKSILGPTLASIFESFWYSKNDLQNGSKTYIWILSKMEAKWDPTVMPKWLQLLT